MNAITKVAVLPLAPAGFILLAIVSMHNAVLLLFGLLLCVSA